VKTLIGLALGTWLALGTVAASAAGASGAAPAKAPPAGIEVIVVTAKRPPAQPAAAEPIYEVIVTAKRVSTDSSANRAPALAVPAIAIEAPTLELAIADFELAVTDTVVRL
jgi:hypothetical protein